MGNQIARTACRTNILPGQGPAERNDRWLTPKHIVEALGPFDLDPCGAPGHVLAKHTYLLENGDDGLVDPWNGYVYCNPPYNARIMAPWIERMIEHNNGILLIPASTGIKLWQDLIFPNATAIHFYRHRIEFLRREGFEGGEKMVSPQASAIIAFGDHAADKLVHSDLPGVVIDFR